MRRPVFLILACFATAEAAAQDAARMEAVVQSFVPGGFSGDVLVARGNTVVFRKGYGVDPGARLAVASITKQFTAAAVLRLEERGRLRLDDPVSRYLPDAPSAWRGMTIFHLLSHTAGFQGLQTPPSARRPAVQSPDGTVAGFVNALFAEPLERPPGAAFNYTNSDYWVLGHLIQTLTTQSYERFIQDNILTPLGMKSTTLDTGAVNPNTAVCQPHLFSRHRHVGDRARHAEGARGKRDRGVPRLARARQPGGPRIRAQGDRAGARGARPQRRIVRPRRAAAVLTCLPV